MHRKQKHRAAKRTTPMSEFRLGLAMLKNLNDITSNSPARYSVFVIGLLSDGDKSGCSCCESVAAYEKDH